jgi:hypothetical protein
MPVVKMNARKPRVRPAIEEFKGNVSTNVRQQTVVAHTELAGKWLVLGWNRFRFGRR